MSIWNWDPLGILGEPQGTGTLGAGILGGPLGFLGSLFGGQFEGGGTTGGSSEGSSGLSIAQQIMPLLVLGLVIWGVVKLAPKILK